MGFFNKIFSGESKETPKTEPILIVSGLPRSGTSMMMKIMETGGFEIVTDSLREADDDNPKGYYELEEVKALGADNKPAWLLDAPGKVVKVISFLLQHLPGEYSYKVIFMRREINEILASQKKMLERRGESSSDSDEKVRETFTEHLKRVKVWLANQKNMEVLYVDHRRLMTDPGDVVNELVQFLGVECSDDSMEKMASVPDQNLYRNRN